MPNPGLMWVSIPYLGIVIDAVRGFARHEASAMAAGIAYYTLFSLFPLLLVIVAGLSFFLPNSGGMELIVGAVQTYAPGLAEPVRNNLTHLTQLRNQMGVVGLLGLYWAASNVFAALLRALNRIWQAAEDLSFLRQRLLALLMVAASGLVLILSFTALTVFRTLQRWAGQNILIGDLLAQPFTLAVTYLLPPLVTFVVIALLYQYVPGGERSFAMVWPGALVSTLGFEAIRYLFGLYVSTVGRFQVIYGSLTTVILVMLWIYLVTVVLLFGAEVARAWEGH